MKNVTKYIALAAVILSMAACREELDPKSIFVVVLVNISHK